MVFHHKKSYVILLISIILLLSLLGCNKDKTNQANNNSKVSTEISEKERAKLSVKAANLIAEEKLTSIFYTYTPPEKSDTTYYITKEGYNNLDDIKPYLNAYYTPGMTDSLIARYIKIIDVPNLGKRPVLQLPDDFIMYRKHQEKDKKDEIKVTENEASLIFYEGDKKITYTFIKENSKWLVDTKIVE